MIFEELNNIESPYNLGLKIKNGLNNNLKLYFQNLLDRFCQDLSLNLVELNFKEIFTDIEFNKRIADDNEESFINHHFYNKLFADLKKTKSDLDFNTKDVWVLNPQFKFCYTLDKSLTPFITTSGIAYGSLSLGNKPVFYYLWVDIQEIITINKNTI